MESRSRSRRSPKEDVSRPGEGNPYPLSGYAILQQAESSGHWWFHARRQLILWTLRKRVPPFRDYLEVGCGTGFLLQAVHRSHPGSRLHGFEFHASGLEQARQAVPAAALRQMDATCLREQERYDCIGAFDVIEHIEADGQVLANLRRALRPGGTLVITVPQHRFLWSAADTYAHHIRRYQRRELLQRIREANLETTHVTSFVSLLLPLMVLQRWLHRSGDFRPEREFLIHPMLNTFFRAAMLVERQLIRCGISLPAGGSLLLVARRP